MTDKVVVVDLHRSMLKSSYDNPKRMSNISKVCWSLAGFVSVVMFPLLPFYLVAVMHRYAKHTAWKEANPNIVAGFAKEEL